MKLIYIILGLALTTAANAETNKSLSISKKQIKLEKTKHRSLEYTKVSVEGFSKNRIVGQAQLPMKSILLSAKPEAINVSVKKGELLTSIQTTPWPAQQEKCRCKNDRNIKFQDQVMSSGKTADYKLTYLGKYRGTPVTRLDVSVADFDPTTRTLNLYNGVQIQTNADEYDFVPREYKNYLIVVTDDLRDSIKNFEQWKQSQGYNVTVKTIEQSQNNVNSIKELVRTEYENNNVDFSILIGSQDKMATDYVSTGSSSHTPSDLTYYLLDGSDDMIPDVFFGRIVAEDAQSVAMQLDKIVELEKNEQKNKSGYKRIVGIASNEGSNPSDNEYILDIENALNGAFKSTSLHLYENDTESNPSVLNSEFDGGAYWLAYMGHGSGTAWPSMYRTYNISDVESMSNEPSVKPIVIDVACQNGRIEMGMLGSRLMTPSTEKSFGAVAFYGGSVDISWHPPAIMSKGIALEHAEKKFKHLGEALLAGQLYLAENYNSTSAVVDNMKWYHLQGDPGMLIQ